MAQIGHDNGTTLKIVRQSGDNVPATEAVLETEELESPLDSPEWISRDPILEDYDEESKSIWPRLANALLIVTALGWLGFAGLTMNERLAGYADPLAAARDIAYLTLPLILLSVLWLMLSRSGLVESRRLAHAAAKLQREAAGLDSVLALINARIGSHSEQVREHADELVSYGEAATSRLATVLAQLGRERAELEQHRASLEEATKAAAQQIEVLMRDMPKALKQSQSMTGALTQAGGVVRQEASLLETQLVALTAMARDSERDVGGVAHKLAAQIGQIETAGQTASAEIARVSTELGSAVDGHLERTARAADDVRRLVSEQAQAITALADQSRSGMNDAASAAVTALQTSLEAVEKRLSALDTRAASVGATHRVELEHLADALDENIRAVASLHERGSAQASAMSSELSANDERIEALMTALEASQARISALAADATGIEQRLASATNNLDRQLPDMLARIDELSRQSLDQIHAALPELERAQSLGQSLHTALVSSNDALTAHGDAAETLTSRTQHAISGLHAQIAELQKELEAIRHMGENVAGQTAPQLLDALIRVRETADSAAEKARLAIMNVIPQASAELAEQSGAALAKIIGTQVEERIDALSSHADSAVQAAHTASERLMRQMITIADTTATIEQRVADAQSERETHESDNLARRVAMLIEALNSTAIDVTKLLSNDVTDTAWASYLKGDRGVFTRRAVRLLDNGEARSVQQHYNDDPEFREQVNRYIHDFEAMLRQVLATRDGQVLSVTLLSSDMGKLYVALAQAIERLRN